MLDRLSNKKIIHTSLCVCACNKKIKNLFILIGVAKKTKPPQPVLQEV